MDSGVDYCVDHANNPCSKLLDQDKLNQAVATQCVGKDLCTFNNFKSYFKSNAKSISSSDYSKCTHDDSLFYAQVYCLQTEEDLHNKTIIGFLIGVIIIINAIIFTAAVIWFKQRASEKYEEYDMATTTTSDYTAYSKIEKKVWEDFCVLDAEEQ